MKREDSRRKCGTATPRAQYRGYEAQEKPRDAALATWSSISSTTPTSSLARSLNLLPFSSSSLSFSQKKQLRYLGSAKSETGECICIPGLCGRGAATRLAPLAWDSKFVRSLYVPSTRPTCGERGCVRTCTASRVAAFSSEVIGYFEMSRGGVTASVSFLARYLFSYKRVCVIPRGKSGDLVHGFPNRKIPAYFVRPTHFS